jgi:hypothetical protein
VLKCLWAKLAVCFVVASAGWDRCPFYSVHPIEDEENSGCLYEICIDRDDRDSEIRDLEREREGERERERRGLWA